MWRVQNTVMHWFNGLDRQELTMLVLVVLTVGLLCMRGFGSRSNY
jgi:hypothetical protein